MPPTGLPPVTDAARPVGRAGPRPYGGAARGRTAGRRAEPRLPGRAAIRRSARVHAPAIRLERDDARPVRPRARRAARHASLARSWRAIRPAYPFLPVEGESLHQIPVGPVHAGIIEPGHFRFTADGETVVRLEQRLGYVHKGIEHLMHGATLEQARAARRPHVRATAPSPMRSPSPAPWKRRSASSRRRARSGCAA